MLHSSAMLFFAVFFCSSSASRVVPVDRASTQNEPPPGWVSTHSDLVERMLLARATQTSEVPPSLLDRSVSQKEPDDTLEKLEDRKSDFNTKKKCIDKLLALAADPKTSDDLSEKVHRAAKAVSDAFESAGGASVIEELIRYQAVRFIAYVGYAHRSAYLLLASALKNDKSPRVRAQAANAIYNMDKLVAHLADFKDVMNGKDQSVEVQKTVDYLLNEFYKKRCGGTSTVAKYDLPCPYPDVYTARCGGTISSAYPCGDH